MPNSLIFTIPENVIDENGHVNNVAYVQWMQDAAVTRDQTGAKFLNNFARTAYLPDIPEQGIVAS